MLLRMEGSGACYASAGTTGEKHQSKMEGQSRNTAALQKTQGDFADISWMVKAGLRYVFIERKKERIFIV